MISEAGTVAHISPSHWVATGAVDQLGLGARLAPMIGDTGMSRLLPVIRRAWHSDSSKTLKGMRGNPPGGRG